MFRTEHAHGPDGVEVVGEAVVEDEVVVEA